MNNKTTMSLDKKTYTKGSAHSSNPTDSRYVCQVEIINRIADKSGLKKKDVKKMLMAFKEVIYDVMKEGNVLFLKNIMTMKTVIVPPFNKYLATRKDYVYQEEHRRIKIVISRKFKEAIKASDYDNEAEDEFDENTTDKKSAIQKQIRELQAMLENLPD